MKFHHQLTVTLFCAFLSACATTKENSDCLVPTLTPKKVLSTRHTDGTTSQAFRLPNGAGYTAIELRYKDFSNALDDTLEVVRKEISRDKSSNEPTFIMYGTDGNYGVYLLDPKTNTVREIRTM